MVDAYRLRSPLDHLGLTARAQAEAEHSGTGVVLSEIAHLCLINIRGDASDPAFIAAVEKSIKLTPPTAPNTVAGKPSQSRIMWLGPDEWLVITKPGRGERAMAELWKNLKDGKLHAAVTDSSEARTCIRIEGPRAREVLAKGCPIDLHPSAFGPGQSAQCIVAKCGVMLVQTAQAKDTAGTYELYVLRSFATYLWTWLEDASQEFGVRVA